MEPRKEFLGLEKRFWANVRTISQKLGYVVKVKRKKRIKGVTGPIKVPTLSEIKIALESIKLTATHIVRADGSPTDFGRQIINYFDFRADVLNRIVEPQLMTAEQAEALYTRLKKEAATGPRCSYEQKVRRKKEAGLFHRNGQHDYRSEHWRSAVQL